MAYVEFRGVDVEVYHLRGSSLFVCLTGTHTTHHIHTHPTKTTPTRTHTNTHTHTSKDAFAMLHLLALRTLSTRR